MNRLSTRLLLSHALVAAIGGLTTYLLVRVLAPQMYDNRVRTMMGGQMMGGAGLRGIAVGATNNAVLIGVLVGVLTAAVAGAWSARRVMQPLQEVRAATRRLAAGNYDQPIELPEEPELAAVAMDVNALAGRLADTEARRLRLLGEVAHEMRTPLTVVDGYVEGLVDGVFEPSQQLYADLGAEIQRLRRLSDDLGELSRAEERGFDLRLAVVDVAEVAARAAERLRAQFEDGEVALEVVPAEGPMPVHGDVDRLAQLVTNLVGNALAATPTGGAVRVQVDRGGGDVLLTVSDTGVGLSSQDLGHIFERFYRAAAPHQDGRRSGTGIGLTIARGIAEAHGGRLDASSPGLGLGAVFTVRIPGCGPSGVTDGARERS